MTRRTGVEEDEPVRADEVDAAATGLAAEEEDEETEMDDENETTSDSSESEQIRPLRRSDDFVLAM